MSAATNGSKSKLKMLNFNIWKSCDAAAAVKSNTPAHDPGHTVCDAKLYKRHNGVLSSSNKWRSTYFSHRCTVHTVYSVTSQL